MKKIVSHSLEETEKIAQEWVNSLKPKEDEATVIGLSGNLGSGKTTFVQAVARGLGIDELVTSPTFVIMKIYPTRYPIFSKLIHIDAYRLESFKELEVIDFENISSNPHNLVLIEWPEKLIGFDKNIQIIKFDNSDKEKTRTIIF